MAKDKDLDLTITRVPVGPGESQQPAQDQVQDREEHPRMLRNRCVGEINGEPGCVFEDRDGRAIAVVALDIADDQVKTIRAVANPEKLQHLGRSER